MFFVLIIKAYSMLEACEGLGRHTTFLQDYKYNSAGTLPIFKGKDVKRYLSQGIQAGPDSTTKAARLLAGCRMATFRNTECKQGELNSLRDTEENTSSPGVLSPTTSSGDWEGSEAPLLLSQ